MSFKDFKNGLQSANDYLDTKHHISGTQAGGTDALRGVVSAEYSFTLRELLCGLLAGNGLKLPNVQICLHSNIGALLNLPNLQSELNDALNELQGELEKFMDHTKFDQVLGRLNGVLAEAQNVANMINFCKTPVDPIAIPNMLERAMGSFLGAGKDITDSIGQIADADMCACIDSSGGFNTNIFQGGLLGNLSNNINKITSGSLVKTELDAILNDVKSIGSSIKGLIAFENDIGGSFSRGGSQFATPDPGCNAQIGVMHNGASGGIAGNARLTSQLKSLYDRLGGYPVQFSKGSSTGQPGVGHQYDSNGNRILGEEVIEFPNIFHLLLDQELLNLLQQDDNPQPNVDTQTPVYDYCGNVIGFTKNHQQRETEQSAGSLPQAPNSPGYNAGGFTTDTSNVSGGGSTVSGTTIINNFAGTGNTLYVVGSESAQNSLSTNENDIVVRSDILTVFTRKDPSSSATGTINDYQQATSTLLEFLNNLNVESGSGLIVKDAGVSRARKVEQTAGQIKVTNADGVGGDIKIELEENTRIPGTAAIKIPVGTTAQRPQTEVGEIRYNSDTHSIEAYFGDTTTWKSFLTTSSATGINGGTNAGSGSEVFKDVSGPDLRFRSIIGGTGITATQNADDITLTDSISASNVGTGTGLFDARTGDNFSFKSITSTDGTVTITDTATTVDVSSMGGIPSDPLQTTDASATILQFNGTTPEPATGKTWFFEIKTLGVATTGEKQAFKIEGLVTNSGGNYSLIGTNIKIDLQKSGTADIGVTPWDSMASYNQGDTVEFELNTYTANNAITGGYPNNNLDPAQDSTNWTLAYSGWNVSAEIIANQFRVRAKGATGKTVTWSAAISFIEA
tara:strand:- start:1374 stop:3926 length:2553 start_codon:yes stop_codon:yes gene_type:complete